MVKVSLKFDIGKIYDEIDAITSSIGKNQYNDKGEPLYDMIRTKMQDRDTLQAFFNMALNNITTELRNLNASVGLDYDIVFYVPRFDNENLREQYIEFNMKDYIRYFVLSEWLRRLNMPHSQSYIELANVAMRNLVAVVMHKDEPEKGQKDYSLPK